VPLQLDDGVDDCCDDGLRADVPGRWLLAATVFAPVRIEERGFDRRTSDIYAHDEIGHVRKAGLSEPGVEARRD